MINACQPVRLSHGETDGPSGAQNDNPAEGTDPDDNWSSRRWQDDIVKQEGTVWSRTALDRRQWKALIDGYILQWMVKAYVSTKKTPRRRFSSMARHYEIRWCDFCRQGFMSLPCRNRVNWFSAQGNGILNNTKYSLHRRDTWSSTGSFADSDGVVKQKETTTTAAAAAAAAAATTTPTLEQQQQQQQ